MLNFNKILIIIISAISFAGCLEHRVIFDFNKDVNQNFFKEIPGIGDTIFTKFPVTKKAANAEVYVSSFRERFIENENLLEFTELNDDSKIPSVDYWSDNGYVQNLYLIKYKFTYAVTTKKGKIVESPAEGVVFFSVRHNGRGYTTGISPCYFGIIDPDENLIGFDVELILKKANGKYYLKAQPNKKNRNGLLFMPANFPSNPKKEDEKFTIEKIVKLDPNKIGGNKPLVFDIAGIFHDSTALSFHYVNTINLTQ
jgi:hypothetical protein